jgi:murein L,D-transpeptidase YafK
VWACLLYFFVGCSSASADADVWLDIDTEKLTLTVMQDQRVLKIFENIAIGSNGVSWSKQLGDEKTPLGRFTVTEVRPSDRFVKFIAFDYPNLDHIQRAFDERRIDLREYEALKGRVEQGRSPPQDTNLGGHLGIHGLGAGSREIHKTVNWTNGCIALSNEQLAQLLPWVRRGTEVSLH